MPRVPNCPQRKKKKKKSTEYRGQGRRDAYVVHPNFPVRLGAHPDGFNWLLVFETLPNARPGGVRPASKALGILVHTNTRERKKSSRATKLGEISNRAARIGSTSRRYVTPPDVGIRDESTASTPYSVAFLCMLLASKETRHGGDPANIPGAKGKKKHSQTRRRSATMDPCQSAIISHSPRRGRSLPSWASASPI